MTKGNRNILFILLAVILLVFGGGLFFVYSFFRAFAPTEITITKTEIMSSDGFVNPITIEKLAVDSFGNEVRPVRYTIKYLTTCSIKQKGGKPPIPLKKIKLSESGRYIWSEEYVNIPIVHDGRYPQRKDSTQGIIWSMGDRNFDICQIKFEKENWYFVNFLDPNIVGIYIYVDKSGDLHQYTVYSGVSPI